MKQLIDVRASTPDQLQAKVDDLHLQGYVKLEGGVMRDLQGNYIILMVYAPPKKSKTPLSIT